MLGQYVQNKDLHKGQVGVSLLRQISPGGMNQAEATDLQEPPTVNTDVRTPSS